MSGEAPLVLHIEGYTITVFIKDSEGAFGLRSLGDIPLKLSKVGGAHITNVDSLVMMIEDAVFKEENSGDSG